MLADFLPKVIEQIGEMKEICAAEQPEFDTVNKEVDRLLANRFVKTADEHGIVRMEKELSITPRPGQKLEERRIAILARASKNNIRYRDVVNMISNYSDEIKMIPEYNLNKLTVVAGEEIENVKEIYNTLDQIIPLNVRIRCEYDSWHLDGSEKLDGSKKLNSGATRKVE